MSTPTPPPSPDSGETTGPRSGSRTPRGGAPLPLAGGPGGSAGMLRRAAQAATGRFARQGMLSVADQMALSATNFLAGLLLARHASPDEYGAYVLAFTVMLFFSGVQSALLTSPMTILGAPLEDAALRAHVSTITACSLALGTGCAVASLAAAAGVRFLLPASTLAPALAGMALAQPFVQAQETFRRALYLRLLPGRVLANDLLYCSLQLGGLLLLFRHDAARPGGSPWLTGGMVFVTMAGSALAGTLLGAWQARTLITRSFLGGAGQVLRESWPLAKWGLGSLAGQMMSFHANRFIAAAFAGTAGVAALEAPRLLVAPLQIIGTGAGNLTLPKASRHYAEGGMRAMLRFLTPVALLWGGAFVGYAGLIAVAAPFWLRLAYAGKYDGSRWILVVWCAANALMGLRVMQSTALRATRNLRPTMTASLLSGAVVVVASVAGCATLGAGGAALAKLTGEVTLGVALTVAFVRLLRGRYGPTGAPAPAVPEEAE